jgi:hypothetical protein
VAAVTAPAVAGTSGATAAFDDACITGKVKAKCATKANDSSAEAPSKSLSPVSRSARLNALNRVSFIHFPFLFVVILKLAQPSLMNFAATNAWPCAGDRQMRLTRW